MNTIKVADTLLMAGKETCLEVNTDKTKYTFISRHQNLRQNHN
jgi:hypothetical protein